MKLWVGYQREISQRTTQSAFSNIHENNHSLTALPMSFTCHRLVPFASSVGTSMHISKWCICTSSPGFSPRILTQFCWGKSSHLDQQREFLNRFLNLRIIYIFFSLYIWMKFLVVYSLLCWDCNKETKARKTVLPSKMWNTHSSEKYSVSWLQE